MRNGRLAWPIGCRGAQRAGRNQELFELFELFGLLGRTSIDCYRFSEKDKADTSQIEQG